MEINGSSIQVSQSTLSLNREVEAENSNQLSGIARNTARNIGKIALPLIAFSSLSILPSADAGPLAYASCIAGCAATGPFAGACWSACLIALGLPSP